MSKLIACFLVALLSFGLLVNEASAKRFGGGRSFGVQRSQSSLFSANKSYNTSALKQKPAGSRWGGMLGGLLVGSLLASLFMGHGLGSGLLSWLIVGAVLFFIISFVRKRMQPSMQTNQANTFGQNSFSNFTNAFTSGNNGSFNNATGQMTTEYPEGFDAESFLREAKVTFNRLQAAYDKKNLDDLTTFTAPEVFGEIKMQLDEMGNAPNKTEVISLDAQLLDCSKQFDSLIASVRFTGSVKENDAPVTQLDEIWHFRRFGNNPNWVVGGIQQEVIQP